MLEPVTTRPDRVFIFLTTAYIPDKMLTKKTPIFTLLAVMATLAAPPLASAQLAPQKKGADYEKNAAAKIDKLVADSLRRASIPMPSVSTDEEYLRRTYLTVTGRIPSYDEAKSFLDDKAPDKRSKLVNRLFDTDGYRSHTFNWWADLLRITDTFARTSGEPYKQWIRNSIAENKPYDKLVKELLDSSGGGWEKDNGAVGYYVRDRGMPLDNMSNTVRVFLGTRMECAQCHDHPNDSKIKQIDFYEMAAFTDGLKSVRSDMAGKVGRNDNDRPREIRDLGRMLRYAVYDFSITGGKKDKATIKLPSDFKSRGGEPGEWIEGGTPRFFGKSLSDRISSKTDARGAFSDWVASPENDRFVKVIANRLWKRVMGTGLFEPVDDLNSGSVPANGELLGYLTSLMRDVNFDMMAYQRILLNTKTYNLAANPQQASANEPYHQGGRQLRRMTAEQIWDSLLTLIVENPDARKSSRYGNAVYWKGKPVLVGKKTMNDVYKEVIKLNSSEAFWKYTEKLLKDIKADGGGGKGDSMRGGDRSDDSGLKRASELSSPMKPGHFLRQFGQSSREVIQGGSTESDVTQVLSILNGHVERDLVNNGSAAIYKHMDKAKSPAEKINVLFLSTLTRKPTPDELQFMLAEVKADGRNGYQNVLAALVSTSEFIFVK